MNFTSPMTLAAFAESNNVCDVSKSIFPYEHWENIEDIMRCTKFPPLAAFKSSLSKPGGEKFIEELAEVSNEISNFNLSEDEIWATVSKFFGIPKSDLIEVLKLEDTRFTVNFDGKPDIHVPVSPLKYKFSKNFFDTECLTMLDYLRIVLICSFSSLFVH